MHALGPVVCKRWWMLQCCCAVRLGRVSTCCRSFEWRAASLADASCVDTRKYLGPLQTALTTREYLLLLSRCLRALFSHITSRAGRSALLFPAAQALNSSARMLPSCKSNRSIPINMNRWCCSARNVSVRARPRQRHATIVLRPSLVQTAQDVQVRVMLLKRVSMHNSMGYLTVSMLINPLMCALKPKTQPCTVDANDDACECSRRVLHSPLRAFSD